jgi:hypothetical protein
MIAIVSRARRSTNPAERRESGEVVRCRLGIYTVQWIPDAAHRSALRRIRGHVAGSTGDDDPR